MPLGESPGSASSNRPPYKFVSGDVHTSEILNAAGLDPSIYGTTEFIAQQGMTALWELFSDGELRILTLDQYAAPGDLQRASGKERFGEFYDKLAHLREESLATGGPIANEINKLARFSGKALAESVKAGAIQLPDSRTVRPGISPLDGRPYLLFDEYLWQGTQEGGVILEYGPGISGKRFLDTQMEALRMGVVPYQYIAVSDGPFINQYLQSYFANQLDSTFGPGASQLAYSGRYMAGREDGMLQATSALLATPQPSGTHEFCDVIMLIGVHEAAADELEFALHNSPKLMRSGGKLFLSAPIEKIRPGVTTYSEQLGWALEAGLKLEWSNETETGDPDLGTATTSGIAVLVK